jgi:hypothetical protein
VTVGIEVPTAKANGDGTDSQAVEEAGCGVGEHRGAEAKLVVEKEALENGQSGRSVQWRLAVEEGDNLLDARSSSLWSSSGLGLRHRLEATRAHEGNLGDLLWWLAWRHRVAE